MNNLQSANISMGGRTVTVSNFAVPLRVSKSSLDKALGCDVAALDLQSTGVVRGATMNFFCEKKFPSKKLRGVGMCYAHPKSYLTFIEENTYTSYYFNYMLLYNEYIQF